ncbi:MAG TPA: C45 family peptidase [Patescibacteria group bacterium]|nr:C45 family peptidase [Patescibacteria group bacterium]
MNTTNHRQKSGALPTHFRPFLFTRPFWQCCIILFYVACLIFPMAATAAPMLSPATINSSGLVLVATFEDGKLYQAGKFKVLELNGTYQKMGRQYGGLLGAEIQGMYAVVTEQYEKNHIVNPQATLPDFAAKLFSLYPRQFQEMARGIAETSGMETDKLAVLNEFFDYMLLYSTNATQNNHCATMTAWGTYTSDSSLVMGRNFDFPAFFREFDPYITVVVYNPSDTAQSAAVVTYPGQIGSIQTFNSPGLILENNDGSSCGDPERYFGRRIPFLISDLEMMLDHSTLAGLDAALHTRRLHYPLIFNLADATTANTYEISTADMKKRTGGTTGLLIGVNHFISPDWPLAMSESAALKTRIEDSAGRYRNLAALAEAYKGSLDSRKMMEILDIPVAQGGATPQDRSIYQFVAVPQQGKIWLKALSYEDWTEIDLTGLYSPTRNQDAAISP